MDLGQTIILAMIVAMFVLFMSVLGVTNLYVMISDIRAARRHEHAAKMAKTPAAHHDEPPHALAA